MLSLSYVQSLFSLEMLNNWTIERTNIWIIFGQFKREKNNGVNIFTQCGNCLICHSLINPFNMSFLLNKTG